MMFAPSVWWTLEYRLLEEEDFLQICSSGTSSPLSRWSPTNLSMEMVVGHVTLSGRKSHWSFDSTSVNSPTYAADCERDCLVTKFTRHSSPAKDNRVYDYLISKSNLINFSGSLKSINIWIKYTNCWSILYFLACNVSTFLFYKAGDYAQTISYERQSINMLGSHLWQ